MVPASARAPRYHVGPTIALFIYIGLKGHMTMLQRPPCRVYNKDAVTSAWSSTFKISDGAFTTMQTAEAPLTARLHVLKKITKRPAGWTWDFCKKLAVPGWRKTATGPRHRTVRNRERVKLRALHPRSRVLRDSGGEAATF